jgi:hypothetical protein
MIPGIRGSLLSVDALERIIPDRLRDRLDESGRGRARRRLRAWHLPLRSVLGPACAARTVCDRLAVPLFSQLGYHVVPAGGLAGSSFVAAHLEAQGVAVAVLVVTPWGHDPASAWRIAVRRGIGHGVRWCISVTGVAVRVVDAARTYSRRFLEFDLTTVVEHENAFAVFWGLLRAEALRSTASNGEGLLDAAVAISETHRAAVRASLQEGVHDALGHLHRALADATSNRRHRDRTRAGAATRRAPMEDEALFTEALQIVYRVLFLLFAEARGLVPQWHPTYRDAYTIEAIRRPVEISPRPRGVWETLQSIARLAHRGCRIGALRVTPFNGPLFSPLESPLADSLRLDDGAVRQALLALTTRGAREGRQRIAYGDLGVEQLGGVYERLLDVDPPPPGQQQKRGPAPAVRHSERRKATGSFYTPRSLTEYVVRRTLAPLVQGASSDRILELRVLDPAMGSGAFLVAACRYLAAAYESALLGEGAANGEDIGERERAGFRRSIAQRCLYGVDLNPTAVQLGRLSLWLTTLAADRPLTFLDHRLRAGNSLVGAAVSDLARDPRITRNRERTLPLFEDPERDDQLRGAIGAREAIAVEPGDTLAQVRAKEQALSRLAAERGALARWKSACDLWCAAWFTGATALHRAGRSALIDVIVGRGVLPPHVAAPHLAEAASVAARERFFHWTLEFPEVFHSADGTPVDGAGFDAVIGNPPWEMLRGDRGDQAVRRRARVQADSLKAYVRGSGTYRFQGSGHANLYLVFLERMLTLVRRGGRLGAVVPWGLASDHGAARLRRRLLDATSLDTLVSFENRDGVFPIHRGLRFLLICATIEIDPARSALPCRFGVRRADDLERAPELGRDPDAIAVPRALIARTDPISLSLPDVRDRSDLDLLGYVSYTSPPLGDPAGWNAHFGRELNATDDRTHFRRTRGPGMIPIVEGKHVAPFVVDRAAPSQFIHERDAAHLLPQRPFSRPRLVYRDVASSTNRLTLIAAIVPPDTVTTHTLFCLRDPLDEECQLYLCGMLNSLVANYLVRLRVTTHVTTAIVERLPLPRHARKSARFQQVIRCAAALRQSPDDPEARGALHAHAAVAYALNRAQFRRVLETFPLVPMRERERSYAMFCDIVT